MKNERRNLSRKFFIFNFSFLILLAFALRLYRLDFQSIWWDEGHSIQMASAPIAQIPTLPGMDVHPPGFFAALHLWMRAAGTSEFALRYFSLVFSVLTVALLIRFGRLLGGHPMALLTGLLAAASPFYVAYAQEVRMYALVTFFAVASMYFLWRIQSRSGRDFKPRQVCTLYILTTAAALYTHYFTLFLLAFQNLLWLSWALVGWRHKQLKPRLWMWLGAQGGVLALFAPQLWLASRQITTYANPNLNPPALGYFITHTWQAYTLGLTFDPGAAQPYLWALLALLVAGAGLGIGHAARIVHHASFLLTWFLIPLTFYFIVLQFRPSYEPRYMMLVTPALFLLMGLVFSQNRWTSLLAVATLAIFVLGLRSYFFNPTFFKDDSAGVTAFLAAETTPDDLVLVDVPHPFHYYARRIPAPTEYLFVDIHTAADTLNQKALGKKRLFWVTWWGSDTDPRGVIPFLAQKQAGPPQGERQFRGYRVTWYALSNRPFSLPTDVPPANVNFDNVLRLDGLAFGQTLSAGQMGWATMHFTQSRDTTVNYKVSVRLRAPDGRVLAQSDKFILNDRHFQTSAWPLDDPALNQALNVFTLPLTDATYRGALTLEAVVYNGATGDAIAAYGVPTTNGDFVSAPLFLFPFFPSFPPLPPLFFHDTGFSK